MPSECVAEDIPFFLELMSYDANIEDTKGKEYATVKPHKVIEMMREFAKPRYNVDVLKVEVPVNMAYVAGFAKDEEAVYTKEQATAYFVEQTKAAAGVPFIFLSAGVRPGKIASSHLYKMVLVQRAFGVRQKERQISKL